MMKNEAVNGTEVTFVPEFSSDLIGWTFIIDTPRIYTDVESGRAFVLLKTRKSGKGRWLRRSGYLDVLSAAK